MNIVNIVPGLGTCPIFEFYTATNVEINTRYMKKRGWLARNTVDTIFKHGTL